MMRRNSLSRMPRRATVCLKCGGPVAVRREETRLAGTDVPCRLWE